MKEYTYEVEHSWEKQRRPVVGIDRQHRHHHHHHHCQRSSGDDADASSMSGKHQHLYSIALLNIYLKLNVQSFASEYTPVWCCCYLLYIL